MVDHYGIESPWRAPGAAPVANACGLAGGTPWGSDAPEEGKYVNTSFAHHGMAGTDLPPLPTGDQGGAAVVQCRGDPPGVEQDTARSRRRIGALRKQLGWTARASGEAGLARLLLGAPAGRFTIIAAESDVSRCGNRFIPVSA